MESEKLKSSVTAKAAAQAGTHGKTQSVDDEKASLVKAGRLPAYLQRVTTADEEKEKWLMKQKAAQMQKLSTALYSEADKKK